MTDKPGAGKSGYDKYVNYKTFSIAVAAFVALLVMPVPESMLDVAVEYAAGAVGPITLNMAAITGPGTTLIPFMGLITAASSSFDYMLVIGTPPNAIVYASGLLGPKDFLRVGVPCFIAAFLVLMLLSWLYWPLIGYPGLNSM